MCEKIRNVDGANTAEHRSVSMWTSGQSTTELSDCQGLSCCKRGTQGTLSSRSWIQTYRDPKSHKSQSDQSSHIEPALYHLPLNAAFVNLASYVITAIDRNGGEIPHLTATNSPSLTAWNLPILLLVAPR